MENLELNFFITYNTKLTAIPPPLKIPTSALKLAWGSHHCLFLSNNQGPVDRFQEISVEFLPDLP